MTATIDSGPAKPAPPAPPPSQPLVSFWMAVVALAGVLVLVRLYFKLRTPRGQRRADMDEREIERLRSQGYYPFKEYPVDFFLALPDLAACQAVRQELEPQGYTVDVKEVDAELRFSLHATRTMHLIVPEMQALSRRLTQLAELHHGHYDGWVA